MRSRLISLLFMLLSSLSTSAEESCKILLVSAKPDHPHGSHMYEFECTLLAKTLQNTPRVKTVTISSWPPSDEELADVRSIVFYSNPIGNVVLSPANRQQFLKLMRDNVGLVAIHWATGVGYNKLADSETLRAEFKNSLGGWFRRPPCDVLVGQALLKKPNGEHPIYRGWKAWEIRDEFYLNPVLHKQAKPLLEVKVEGKTHVVGWTFDRPNAGRSVGITLGHFHHNFAREDFRRVLANSILWSAKQPIPNTGADVSVKDDDLTLPREKVKSIPIE